MKPQILDAANNNDAMEDDLRLVRPARFSVPRALRRAQDVRPEERAAAAVHRAVPSARQADGRRAGLRPGAELHGTEIR